MNKKLDLTKPVQTRDGLKATIVCTNAGGSQPVIALIDLENGRIRAEEYDLDGSFSHDKKEFSLDLINVPNATRSVTFWVLVSSNGRAQFSFREPLPSFLVDSFACRKVELVLQEEEGIS